MPTLQPFQNGINSVRAELSAAAAVNAPQKAKDFLRPGERLGILPPRSTMLRSAELTAGTAGNERVSVPASASRACGAALSFEQSTALAAPGLTERQMASGNLRERDPICPPSNRFSILEGIGAYVRRTLPFVPANDATTPVIGGVISGALDDPGQSGLVARTAYNETAARSIGLAPGTPATIANGDGVAGDPTTSVDATLVALAGLTGRKAWGLLRSNVHSRSANARCSKKRGFTTQRHPDGSK